MILAAAILLGATPASYLTELSEWREKENRSLLAERGWLSVDGLYWLEEGYQTIGTAASNEVVLPEGTAAPRIGTVTRLGKSVTLSLDPGVAATSGGEPFTSGELKSDASGKQTRVQVGPLTLTVIERGTRIGIRLYNRESKARKTFNSRSWYPGDLKWKISAKYVAYPHAKQLIITNVLGDKAPVANPGYVLFTVNGKSCRLEAQDAGDGLFFNFHDLTSAKTTYGAGRFLDADKPKNGVVVLDFNRATSPPCAFTTFATCPLPPAANFLNVGILAGEKATGHHE